MTELKIRRYKKSDNKTVWDLHVLGLKQSGTYLGSGDWDKDLDNIEEIYLKNGQFLIGEINGKIVAMGAFKKISDGLAQVKRIRVLSPYQRRGFGQAILDKLEKTASRMGYKTIRLDTIDRNLAAQKFFEKNGYAKTKTEMLEKYNLEIIYYEKKLK